MCVILGVVCKRIVCECERARLWAIVCERRERVSVRVRVRVRLVRVRA